MSLTPESGYLTEVRGLGNHTNDTGERNMDDHGPEVLVAPDVFDPATDRGEARATRERSFDAFAKVRALGFPVALAL